MNYGTQANDGGKKKEESFASVSYGTEKKDFDIERTVDGMENFKGYELLPFTYSIYD